MKKDSARAIELICEAAINNNPFIVITRKNKHSGELTWNGTKRQVGDMCLDILSSVLDEHILNLSEDEKFLKDLRDALGNEIAEYWDIEEFLQ